MSDLLSSGFPEPLGNPGTLDAVDAVPGSDPWGGNPGTGRNHGLYVDVAALLSGGLPPAPIPTILNCNDGIALFYAGQVNLLFGDPESGKTWVALAAVAESLRIGKTAAVVDIDHNGAEAILARLLTLGAPIEALTDPERFAYLDPDDTRHLLAGVADLASWGPAVAVIDSTGELLPAFGANSNDADDFTRVHSRVLKPLAKAGSAVLLVDHLAKGAESRAMGSTGTAAKKRVVGGVSLRVTVAEQFRPGQGGACHLTIAKDRHGGLRKHRTGSDKEPLAGTFRLFGDVDPRPWDVFAPAEGQRNPTEQAAPDLVARLLELDPLPTSGEEAAKVLRCRKADALKALKEAREARTVPGSHTRGGNREPEPAGTLLDAEGSAA